MKLLETIRFEKGKFENLAYHQKRMNRARWDLFGKSDEIDLEDILQVVAAEKEVESHPLQASTLEVFEQKIFKCRITYAEQIDKIEFIPYQPPAIHSLKIIYDNKINYQYKYHDRSELDKLFAAKGIADDILIVKNGQLTDTYYANILFFDGSSWITPAQPLLQGTRRESLLNDGTISAAEILLEDLQKFQKARLINAMIRFEDGLDVEIENISL